MTCLFQQVGMLGDPIDAGFDAGSTLPLLAPACAQVALVPLQLKLEPATTTLRADSVHLDVVSCDLYAITPGPGRTCWALGVAWVTSGGTPHGAQPLTLLGPNRQEVGRGLLFHICRRALQDLLLHICRRALQDLLADI
eukprot:3239897-Amphidinium_carterae.1